MTIIKLRYLSVAVCAVAAIALAAGSVGGEAADAAKPAGEDAFPEVQMMRKLKKNAEGQQSQSHSKSDWELILVNADNPLPKDFTVDLVEFQPPYRVDKRIYAPAERMFERARADGIPLMVCSSYRSVSSQQRNFNAKVAEWKSYGYSDEQARANTLKYIAMPGTSEHHTGLTLDIVTPSYTALNSGYDRTAAAKWLRENAHRYGFILRYPADKQQITGIAFEPWHYRYVGETAAKIIFDEKICLEEFISGGYTTK